MLISLIYMIPVLEKLRSARTWVSLARQVLVILVVDHNKSGAVETAVLRPLTMVQSVVTDFDVEPDIPLRLGKLGIRVILA